MNEVLLIYALALALAWPLGRYMASVYSPAPTALDRVFGPVERLIYCAIGARPDVPMGWPPTRTAVGEDDRGTSSSRSGRMLRE
jgi:K+-transporting ATPase A subunit